MKLDGKVLRYETRTIFPSDPDRFAAQLRKHPWFAYAEEKRREHGTGRTVPRYHYTAPEGYFNDGTGFCRWKGKWHLFYGSLPERTEGGGFVWGHAVSDDLIRWMDLPPAIVNGPEPETWTGSVYVEEDRAIAAYRAYGGGEMGIGIAVSSDPLLLNWEKIPGEAGDYLPIHADPSKPEGNTGDPCIWKEDGAYYLISGKTENHPGSGELLRQGYLYRSTDLEHWEYLHPFLEDDRLKPLCDDLSCPTFWPLEERHLLIHYSHTYGARYILGDYDGDRHVFCPAASDGFGNGCFPFGGVGPTTSTCADGRVTMLYELSGSNHGDTWFPQTFCLPREIGLRGKYRDELTVKPAGAYESLRGEIREFGRKEIPNGGEWVLPDFHGVSYEAEMTFSYSGKPMIELNLFHSPDCREYTSVRVYPCGGATYRQDESFGVWDKSRKTVVTVSMDHSSLDRGLITHSPEKTEVFLYPDEKLHLHVFADIGVLEVFVNDRAVLCARPLPVLEDSDGISLTVRGEGKAVLEQAQIWEMKEIGFPIYPGPAI